MKKEFDFEQVGKRMPYSVPDGFFDKMEEKVMAEVAQTNSKKEGARKGMWGGIFLAIAASVVLLLVVKHHNMPAEEAQPYSFDNVELAYNNLSSDDQQFLMEIYEDDEMFNYEENQ